MARYNKDKKADTVSYDHLPKSQYQQDDILELASEVNGMRPGDRCQVLEILNDGAKFRVIMLTGEKEGTYHKIMANDLRKKQ